MDGGGLSNVFSFLLADFIPTFRSAPLYSTKPYNSSCGGVGGLRPVDVIVEPEYTEADPGHFGTYRLPDGPVMAAAAVPTPPSALMNSGSSSSLRTRPQESIIYRSIYPSIHPSSNSFYSPVMDPR